MCLEVVVDQILIMYLVVLVALIKLKPLVDDKHLCYLYRVF